MKTICIEKNNLDRKQGFYAYKSENDVRAIPLQEVQAAFDRFPKATSFRLMFGMLALTGCRLKELDNMRRDMIYNGVLHFFLGKKQRTVRKVRLPNWYWEEYEEMVNNDPPRGNKLFPITNDSFRRYFINARHALGGAWLKKTIRYRRQKPVEEYKLQLNGLRKNYQTIIFAHEWVKWEDANVALEFASKEMKHSSKHVTAHHYIQNFDQLGFNRNQPPGFLLSEGQKSLGEWF